MQNSILLLLRSRPQILLQGVGAGAAALLKMDFFKKLHHLSGDPGIAPGEGNIIPENAAPGGVVPLINPDAGPLDDKLGLRKTGGIMELTAAAVKMSAGIFMDALAPVKGGQN